MNHLVLDPAVGVTSSAVVIALLAETTVVEEQDLRAGLSCINVARVAVVTSVVELLVVASKGGASLLRSSVIKAAVRVLAETVFIRSTRPDHGWEEANQGDSDDLVMISFQLYTQGCIT